MAGVISGTWLIFELAAGITHVHSPCNALPQSWCKEQSYDHSLTSVIYKDNRMGVLFQPGVIRWKPGSRKVRFHISPGMPLILHFRCWGASLVQEGCLQGPLGNMLQRVNWYTGTKELAPFWPTKWVHFKLSADGSEWLLVLYKVPNWQAWRLKSIIHHRTGTAEEDVVQASLTLTSWHISLLVQTGYPDKGVQSPLPSLMPLPQRKPIRTNYGGVFHYIDTCSLELDLDPPQGLLNS